MLERLLWRKVDGVGLSGSDMAREARCPRSLQEVKEHVDDEKQQKDEQQHEDRERTSEQRLFQMHPARRTKRNVELSPDQPGLLWLAPHPNWQPSFSLTLFLRHYRVTEHVQTR